MGTAALFRIGLVLKGVDALLEVAGGIFLMMPVTLERTIARLLQHELLVEPRHHTTARLEHAAAVALANATLLGAVYLIAHGLTKVVLIIAVFKGKRWGYLGLMGVLSAFAIIEIVKSALDRSVAVFLFALFDVLIVYLIAKEYHSLNLRSDRTSGPEPIPEPPHQN